MECVSVCMCEEPGDSKVLSGAAFTVTPNTLLICDLYHNQHYTD